MREIKFRVWNGKETTEIKPRDWGWLGENVINNPNTKYILMQFTNLKDKNSVEVYEGDVVRFQPIAKPAEIYEVIWEHFGFAYKKPSEAGVSTYLQQDYVEVIGNVYENPELLKETL